MAQHIMRLPKSKKKTTHRKPPSRRSDEAARKRFKREYERHQRLMHQQGVPETFLFRGRWYRVIATYTNRRLAMSHAHDWREEEHIGAAVKMYEAPSGKVYAFGVVEKG